MIMTLPDAIIPDDVVPLEIGPGCTRRDLPAAEGIRAWVVDLEPGAQWPHVDIHDETGEQVWVVSGELIEGNFRFGPGTYLGYGPHSRHQPKTETGVRLFGINVSVATGAKDLGRD